MEPLASKLRPKRLEDVLGQKHLFGENGSLSRAINKGFIQNMIFYGPCGCGKTTVANIISEMTNKTLYKVNGATDTLKDVKEAINARSTLMGTKGILLYIDEIHLFNKRAQQSLLEVLESGDVTLIASTTENPYFSIFKALLSRCVIFQFKPLNFDDIKEGLKRGIDYLEKQLDLEIVASNEVLKDIAYRCNGDMRNALNTLEFLVYSLNNGEKIEISKEFVEKITGKKIISFDKDGDNHYDLLSAFQKSIRGSDENAAILYLAMLLKGGDLQSICRRLLVIASEDIGLAYPAAISIVKACVDSALMIGLPEAKIPLAEATLLLATSPKSNSSCVAIDKAMSLLEKKDIGEIPSHLKDSHYSGASKLGNGIGYKYPHDYKNNYVKQLYLPSNYLNEEFYIAGDNKFENSIKNYLAKIKNHV
ncbi:replication-associated recombination protein A [Clostridium bornimense]|uniref:replication-associated recombination protein A n=1 Tax=Clostridium bornimense TaxID=1216932 RepID=UPI001C0FC356|nr:replication-associated recombination protein A [Clostridium bornimense]MBU5315089.1 replication-associated recombination protein A [Clostridium bornimense]